MSRRSTGRLAPTPQGADLIITRSFRAPLEDVWTSVTDSDSTARWYGPWVGTPGAGNTIRVQMVHEEGAPWTEMKIDTCEPPTRLVLSSEFNARELRLELTLRAHGETTELEFTHRHVDLGMVGEFGPGWEYYLDMLVAARARDSLPTFAMYYPALRDDYVAMRDALDGSKPVK